MLNSFGANISRANFAKRPVRLINRFHVIGANAGKLMVFQDFMRLKIINLVFRINLDSKALISLLLVHDCANKYGLMAISVVFIIIVGPNELDALAWAEETNAVFASEFGGRDSKSFDRAADAFALAAC